MNNNDALHKLALEVARQILVTAGESPEHRELAAHLLREANRSSAVNNSGIPTGLSEPASLKPHER
jgi:hypothetical protein